MNKYRKYLLHKVNHSDCREVQALFDAPFYYSIYLDKNRVSDAMDLRSEYNGDIEGPPNCLEVMVALAVRAEEQVLGLDYSDRGLIFKVMLNSLFVTDEPLEAQIQRMLDREYDFDGFGGLFYIPNVDTDMRDVHIYHQMMMYVNLMM